MCNSTLQVGPILHEVGLKQNHGERPAQRMRKVNVDCANFFDFCYYIFIALGLTG